MCVYLCVCVCVCVCVYVFTYVCVAFVVRHITEVNINLFKKQKKTPKQNNNNNNIHTSISKRNDKLVSLVVKHSLEREISRRGVINHKRVTYYAITSSLGYRTTPLNTLETTHVRWMATRGTLKVISGT